MVEVSKKALKEFKQIYKNEFGKKLKNKEAWEMAHNLLNFFDTLLEIAWEEELKKRKLKKFPKGYHLDDDGVYNCRVCYVQIKNKETWYDKHGIKCLNCQRALDKKIIPAYVCKKRDSFYAPWEMQDKFGLHYQTIQKLIRNGELKSRDIQNQEGRICHQIFIKKENKEFFKSHKPNNKIKYKLAPRK